MGVCVVNKFKRVYLGDDKLVERYRKIKPIVTIDGKNYFLNNMTVESLRNNNHLLFGNKKAESVTYDLVNTDELVEMSDKICAISVKNKPKEEVNVYDVLSQIPRDYLNKAVAFSVTLDVMLSEYDKYLIKTKRVNESIVFVKLYRKKAKLVLYDDTLLEDLNSRIFPVIRRSDELYTTPHKYSLEDIKATSYIWQEEEFIQKVDLLNIKPLKRVEMLHSLTYFNPTIAEILSQIPKEYLNYVVAFKIVDYPRIYLDISKYNDELNDGYNVFLVKLYVKRDCNIYLDED